MRPRPDAAENARVSAIRAWREIRFNEAAARCRGKQERGRPVQTMVFTRFNEAAARCRGKLPAAGYLSLRGAALQ